MPSAKSKTSSTSSSASASSKSSKLTEQQIKSSIEEQVVKSVETKTTEKAVSAPKAKASKSSGSKTAAKSVEPVVSAPVATAVVTPSVSPVAELKSTASAPVVQTSEQLFNSVNTTLLSMNASLKSLTGTVRLLQKAYLREQKSSTKKETKAKGVKSGNHKVNGFARPGYISPELCTFLGVPVGTEVARTEVIKRLVHYVKENKLQQPDNKRVIIVDDKLKTLLCPSGKDDRVTFFNIQTYMKKHYQDPAKAKVTSA